MKQPQRKEPLPPKPKKKRVILWIVLGLLLAGLVFGAVHAIRIFTKPASLFTQAPATPIPEPTQLAPAFPIVTKAPAPEASAPVFPAAPAATKAAGGDAPATPAPASANRLNVMLMGIDAYEDGRTTSGTMPHTDAIMVIAINFDENTVDLISLPRDTLTTAPGYYGFYKLNGVFNVGLGGWKRPVGKADELTEGFQLTCRAAETWLGGISIPYYYAVDFQALVDIVDAIGGIDYDVDQPFRAMTSRRMYRKGMQHLDGDAVMGYIRIRNNADGLDSSRTARQRRMMVAIFKKLKKEGKLSQMPALISAANSGIYTNTTLSQTTALANYATKIDENSIRTRSMFGEIGNIEFEWRYVYVDQQNRIDLIREVFGIEAEPVGTCTRQYERWLHTVGFSAMKYMRQAEKVLAQIQDMKNAGTVFTQEQIALYSDCYLAYAALQDAFDSATDTLSPLYAAAPWREKKTPNRSRWTEENVAADEALTALEKEIRQNMQGLQATVKETTLQLAGTIGYKKLSWNVPIDWFKDPDINEVIVAFG